MNKRSIESEIITITEVADYLKVTERTIYRLAGAKKIPACKVGGMWRFSRVDIEAWIKQQSIGKPEHAARKSSNKWDQK